MPPARTYGRDGRENHRAPDTDHAARLTALRDRLTDDLDVAQVAYVAGIARQLQAILDELGGDDLRARLVDVRDKLTATIDDASPAYSASLARQLQAVLGQIDALPDPDAPPSMVDILRARHLAHRAAIREANGIDPPAASRREMTREANQSPQQQGEPQ